MPQRLTQLYAVGDAVEIKVDGRHWQPGQVVAHQHPAVWVRTGNGQRWFVTNGRHIRRVPSPGRP